MHQSRKIKMAGTYLESRATECKLLEWNRRNTSHRGRLKLRWWWKNIVRKKKKKGRLVNKEELGLIHTNKPGLRGIWGSGETPTRSVVPHIIINANIKKKPMCTPYHWITVPHNTFRQQQKWPGCYDELLHNNLPFI